MSEGTKIQWCDDTANFWRGCTKVSAGCANCYAEKNIGVKLHGIKWGKGAARVKSKSAVADCLRWNKKPWVCDHCGTAQRGAVTMDEGCEIFYCPSNLQEHIQGLYHRRRVFSLSLGDWLDPEVPIEWLAEMLATIRRCDQLQFILCTKRPELFFERMALVRKLLACDGGYTETDDAKTYHWLVRWMEIEPPKNVILLTSVENQQAADERIPTLLKIPAACHGLSCEPLLGPVDLNREIGSYEAGNHSPLRSSWLQKLNWLIIGGESGPNARPCSVDWIRSLVAQGKTAGVPTFVKQLGRDPEWSDRDMAEGWHEVFSDPKGGDVDEFPQDLRVCEWPSIR